jgi:nitroimidazol reductase NimA-like FMN-containing flavoprotein (pyridoxamine 5'-phosphate oxidase superfamily)
LANHLEIAKQIIADNIYMTIATASLDGKPWISPVFFAYDKYYNFFWVSNKNSLHSNFIRNNPKVAIVIFDSKAIEGDGDGVYLEAEASELEDILEINAAMKVLEKRVTKDEFKIKDMDEVTNNGAWRIYKAEPKVVSKLAEGEYIDGQYVDKRVPIDLRGHQ